MDAQPGEGREPVRCPFCGTQDAQVISLFGSQLLTSQYRCHACGSYFEGLREDRWDVTGAGEGTHGS